MQIERTKFFCGCKLALDAHKHEILLKGRLHNVPFHADPREIWVSSL